MASPALIPSSPQALAGEVMAQESPMPLSEEAISTLESMVKECLSADKAGRRLQVRKAWQQRAFKQGNQQIYYDPSSYAYMDVAASGLELPRFRGVYNIFTPHSRSFESILSQNPPGINFVPEDLQRGTDVTAAAFAEKMRHRVDRLVYMKDRQGEIATKFCTDGIAFSRTYIEGETGKLRVEIGGALEWKAPLYCGRDMANWGYVVNSGEMDRWQAKAEYPEYADGIGGTEGGSGGSGESTSERSARLNILANDKSGRGYSDAMKDLVTRHIAWIRPWRYLKHTAVSDELTRQFPKGVRVTTVAGKAVEWMAEAMEDTVRVGWCASGEAVGSPSLLNDLPPIQQDFNDYMNLLREHIEVSIPGTWIADTLIDEESLAEQRSTPGAYHLVTVPSGASVSDLIQQETVAQLPPELVANLDRLLTMARFTTGDLPSLSGEGDPHSETASGQKMLSDQAKGQLSPAWQGMQRLMAQGYEIAVKLAAKLSTDRPSISVQGGDGSQMFSPQAILDGNWGCYPDTDSSYPESMADKRAAFQMLTERLGAAGESGLAIVMHPDNLALGVQLGGLSDFIIPAALARNKQLREIEQLLQEAPVPDESQMGQYAQQATMAHGQGQPAPPPPMKATIDVGKRDYHQAELDKVIEWLSSPACHEEQLKGNTQGIQNVELHADQHEQALAQIAQNNAPKPEPPKISLTAAITDPTAISQLLGDAGVQTTPENIQASNAPKDQEMGSKTQLNMAKTQHASAQAQHVAVLAAKEEATPIEKSPTPDELNGKEE